MLQPISRRFLRELDEAPGGNNLQYIYILQYPCIPVSPFFGNQGLHNEIVLGDNRGTLESYVRGSLIGIQKERTCCSLLFLVYIYPN